MRGLAKTRGGKLIAVTVLTDDVGTVTACHIDGDFFIEGDDDASRNLIADLEQTLALCAADHGDRNPPAAWSANLRHTLNRHPDAQLVGVDADTMALALARAITPAGEQSAASSSALSSISSSQQPMTAEKPIVAASDGDATLWRDRWQRLHPHIVHDIPRTPDEQMTIDERWAREVAAGDRPATLRFWEWSSPAIVVGRFQSIPDEVHEDRARQSGFTIVRRCTGGGAMVVQPDGAITYSLYAPLWFIDGLDAADAYRICDGWLVDALRGLGMDAGFQGLNDIASPRGKIGGAAQRRFPGGQHGHGGPGAVLHHTTLAYTLDGELMADVLNTSPIKLADKAVRSASRRVDPLHRQAAPLGIGRDDLIRLLSRAAQHYAADGE